MATDIIQDRGRGPEIVGTRITVYNLLPHFLDPTATEASLCRLYELTAEQVAARRSGYQPRRELDANPELKSTLDLIESGFFSPGRPDDAKPVVNRLLSDGEPFLVLADFAAYALAQDQVDALYVLEDEWSHKAIVNCLNMGYFSSDRSIREYADRIWAVKPVM